MNANRITLAGALVVLTGLLSSCDPNSQYAVTAKVNGQTWQSTGGVSAIKGTYTLLINAYSDNQPAIILSFTDFETPGVYALDSTNNAASYGSYVVRPNRPGTFSITSYHASDKHIAGSFSFKGFSSPTDSMVVTDGAFDLHFQ